MLIDTHSHINFNAYQEDAEEVIKRSLREDVWMINAGSQYATSKKGVQIAERYEKGVYAAVGLHPIHLSEGIFKANIDTEEVSFKTKERDFEYDSYKDLAKNPKVVAIGECGFDYYYHPKTKTKKEQFKERQKKVLSSQLDLAKELELPVIFHCRMAHKELIDFLKKKKGFKGVVHCFTGTWEEAEQYLNMGLYLGFNGIVFKLKLDEIIKKAPLDRILVETDSPYLTPPMAESRRNEPLFVKYVCRKIADDRGLSFEKIAGITTNNAKALFKI